MLMGVNRRAQRCPAGAPYKRRTHVRQYCRTVKVGTKAAHGGTGTGRSSKPKHEVDRRAAVECVARVGVAHSAARPSVRGWPSSRRRTRCAAPGRGRGCRRPCDSGKPDRPDRHRRDRQQRAHDFAFSRTVRVWPRLPKTVICPPSARGTASHRRSRAQRTSLSSEST